MAEQIPTPGKNFSSDNASGIHPDVLSAIADANGGHAVAYGADPYTRRALDLFEENFGKGSEAFLLFNGTAANVLALKGLAKSTEAVICSDEAHLLVDECGAPENFIGCKIIQVPCRLGKVAIEEIMPHVKTARGNVHKSQPRVVSVTQATEHGTVYTLDELRAIAEFAHANDMYMHMDGARIHNAAAALGVSFEDMTRTVGIDIVSFGGTKNGLMMAEAIVVLNPALHGDFPFIRKHGMQLASKHRFLAAQFIAYLQDGLWRRNAEHANRMAALLAQKLAAFDEVTIVAPVEINAVFARVPEAWIKPLQEACYFNVWDAAKNEIRLIASFDTTEDDIDDFVAAVGKVAAGGAP